MNIIISLAKPSSVVVYLRWVETVHRDDLTKLANIMLETEGVEDIFLARYSGEIHLAEHVVTFADFIPVLYKALKKLGMTPTITAFPRVEL